MALTTQVSPYVLVGDLADLPDPASVAVGHLYHAQDTGTCHVLVADLATGVRSWESFCDDGAGETGAAGPAGPAGPTGEDGVTTGYPMWFSIGRNWSAATGVDIRFMANDTPQSVTTDIVEGGSPEPIEFPVPFASTSQRVYYNVTENTLDQGAQMGLAVNGVVIQTFVIAAAFVGPASAVGTVAVTTADVLDVSLALSGDETDGATIAMTATVVLEP